MMFNRRDIGYTVISRFEEAFRRFLAVKLNTLFSSFADGIPSGIIERAKERSEDQDWGGPEEFLDETDFSHLAEIVCFNGMFRSYFPGTNTGGFAQERFQEKMADLYALRCKIAHVRQYFTSLDLDKLIETSSLIANEIGSSGDEFLSFLEELNESPEKVVLPTPIAFFCEGRNVLDVVPNNIPVPDYEYEGGFVGRDEDMKSVLSLLEGDLHRVVTITGAGGVGKTALAFRTLQKMLQKPKLKFDGIIWLSAKETKLSYLGIEDVEPTIKTYDELLDNVLEVLDVPTKPDASTSDRETDVNTLFELHNRILIVIDNLETVRDERIVNFILDAHPKAKFLITSRTGLGQVERRYALKQLKVKEAVYLFRVVARDKNLASLAGLDEEVIRTYVGRVSCYPLAIKWVIGQAAIGRDINVVIDEINEATSDISRFCFEQVYRALSDAARRIICSLSLFEESPSAGVLKYVLDMDQHDFEDGVRELILVSLVIPEQYKTVQGEIATKYTLLSLTRGYVRQQLDKDPSLKNVMQEKMHAVHVLVEEADRAKKQYRFSLGNFGAVSEEEKVAAMIAQMAYQHYQAGRYVEAVDEYKRAVKIAPRFSSIYRNWAAMEAQEGHSVEADELMKKASELSPRDPQIWLTWGNIKRRENKVKEALQKYEFAHKLSPDDGVVLNALGQARMRLGDYEEADRLFGLATQTQEAGDKTKHQVINLTSRADNLARWAKSCELSRELDSAMEKLELAMSLCQESISLDRTDEKSLGLLRHIAIRLGHMYRKRGDTQTALDCFSKAIVCKPVKSMRYREVKDTAIAALNAAKIVYSRGDVERAKQIMCFDPRKFSLRSDPDLLEEYTVLWKALNEVTEGRIVRVDSERKFVIIEVLASPGLTYLGHISSFICGIDHVTDSLIGKVVVFEATESNGAKRARKQARQIRIVEGN